MIMALTVRKIESLKPEATPKKYADGESLYLLVQPESKGGGKLWQMTYRTAELNDKGKRKQKVISFGAYDGRGEPHGVTLAEAREKRAEVKKQLKAGIDPMMKKAEEKAANAAPAVGLDRPFNVWADEYLAKQKTTEAPKTIQAKEHRVGLLKKASFGEKAIGKITRPEVRGFLSGFDALGHHETRERVRSLGQAIFDFAVVDDEREGTVNNPFAPFPKGIFTKKVTKRRPAFTKPADVARLFKAMAIDRVDTRISEVGSLALRFIALTAVRPGEIATAEWSEIDFDEARWTIPAHKMKMKREHIVPLSRQALAILHRLREINGDIKHVFCVSDEPGNRPGGVAGGDAPMNRGTLAKRLRWLGIDTGRDHCPHGFRSTFSTIMNAETDKDERKAWDSDWIEIQLAHIDESSVKAIYNRDKELAHIKGRTRMMQAWADKIDAFVNSGEPIPLRKTA
jgi:integrase